MAGEEVVERMVGVKMRWWVAGNVLSSIHSLSHLTTVPSPASLIRTLRLEDGESLAQGHNTGRGSPDGSNLYHQPHEHLG